MIFVSVRISANSMKSFSNRDSCGRSLERPDRAKEKAYANRTTVSLHAYDGLRNHSYRGHAKQRSIGRYKLALPLGPYRDYLWYVKFPQSIVNVELSELIIMLLQLFLSRV